MSNYKNLKLAIIFSILLTSGMLFGANKAQASSCDTTFYDNRFYVCFFKDMDAPVNNQRNALAQHFDADVPSGVGSWNPGIVHDWGNGQVDQSGLSDQVSAVWRARVNFAGGTYTFHVIGDDGIELNIEGIGVVPLSPNGSWGDHGPTQYNSNPITISANTSLNVQLRWYENQGGATAKLWWDFTPAATPCNTNFPNNQFHVCYFDGMGAPTDASAALSQNDEATIDHDWGSGQVDSSGKSDQVSAVWRGSFNFSAGSYTFRTITDDGVELSVDGNVIVPQWNDHGATEYDGGTNLSAGYHNIQMRWYENGVDAVAKLSWSLTSTTPCDTSFQPNQFMVCYFDGTVAPTDASFTILQKQEIAVPSGVGAWTGFNHDWGTGPVDTTGRSDQVSGVWRGLINFAGGNYTFHTMSDDGIQLYIDGFNNVIDNFGPHGPTQDNSAVITIPAGPRNVQLRWYENYGQAVTGLWWDYSVPLALTESPSSVLSGSSVTVSWTGIPSPSSRDWIGFYPVGANDFGYLSYIFAGSCTATAGNVPPVSGSCTFPIPASAPTGSYKFRLAEDIPPSNGLTGTSNFSVTGVPAPTCTSATPDGDWTISNSGTRTTTAIGVANATSVVFVAYSDQQGSGNSIPYSGTQSGTTWTANIPLSAHPGVGAITVNVYMNNAGNNNVFCDSASFTRLGNGTIQVNSQDSSGTPKSSSWSITCPLTNPNCTTINSGANQTSGTYNTQPFSSWTLVPAAIPGYDAQVTPNVTQTLQ